MTTFQAIRNSKKNIALLLSFIFVASSFGFGNTLNQSYQSSNFNPPEKEARHIKIGLLLDTSNSMDGLIDQAKSQLWNIVNELATAKCEGEKPKIQIALYEYGNDRLTAREGYIRLVTPLTQDLDQISKDLFSLRTNGGSEFCGHVIQTSLRQLDWDDNKEDLKLIFIAGNEPFTQGNVNYRNACKNAAEKGITINTIFCGPFEEGISTNWKNGADLTNGHYMSIEQNRKTIFIPSPYDDQIDKLNTRLNETYIYYGKSGKSKKENQLAQDSNANSISRENKIARTISKGSHVYNNSKWDLVDASKAEDFEIAEVEEQYLPSEMQQMDKQEKTKYIATKKAERGKIQKEISELNILRGKYIHQKKKEMNLEDDMLDGAMTKAIKEQAKTRNFKFD
jgi:hypothetical protein